MCLSDALNIWRLALEIHTTNCKDLLSTNTNDLIGGCGGAQTFARLLGHLLLALFYLLNALLSSLGRGRRLVYLLALLNKQAVASTLEWPLSSFKSEPKLEMLLASQISRCLLLPVEP